MKKKNIFKIALPCVLALAIILLSVTLIVHISDKKSHNPTINGSNNGTDNSEPYVISSATVGSAGDILIHTPIYKAAYSQADNSYDFNNIFDYVKNTIDDCDYFIANLEVTLGGDKKAYSGFPCFNCPDSILDAVKDAGIDCLLTANNHSNDTLYEGMIRTQEKINETGLDYTGTVMNQTDKRYLVKNINGISFGFICYTYETVSGTAGRKSLNGALMSNEAAGIINSFDYNSLDKFYNDIDSQISSMKSEGADVTVVYIHWGNEYILEPGNPQKNIAQELCDMGVDVIVGGHPHVVEPVDLITSTDGSNKTVCVYSLGNFVSNQRRNLMNMKTGHTEDGIIFEMTFSKYSDGSVKFDKVNVIPTWVNMYNENSRKVYNIVPLSDNFDNVSSLGLNKSSNMVNLAKESYNRTVALVQEGTDKCNNWLSEAS